MIIRSYIVVLCLFFILFACEFPFPEAEKSSVPSDHTRLKGGAAHKSGLDDARGCGDSDCHKSDLKGGYVMHEGIEKITPSCYQCHGKKWD